MPFWSKLGRTRDSYPVSGPIRPVNETFTPGWFVVILTLAAVNIAVFSWSIASLLWGQQ